MAIGDLRAKVKEANINSAASYNMYESAVADGTRTISQAEEDAYRKKAEASKELLKLGESELAKQEQRLEQMQNSYNDAMATIYKFKKVSTDDGGGGGEGDGIDERARAIENFYREMKFRSDGYYNYMIGVYDNDRKEFVKLTGDKDKAKAQYDYRVEELDSARAKWIEELNAMSNEELALLKAKEDAVERYYNTMKFEAADYFGRQMSIYEAERLQYEALTGDKAQADAMYNKKATGLRSELLIWTIDNERKEHRLKTANLDEQIDRLETWKNLGLGVGKELQALWTEYHATLKAQSEASKAAYEAAEMDKTNISADELALRKKLYEDDLSAYLAAMDKRRQIQLKAGQEAKQQWEADNWTAVNIWNSMAHGYSVMWKNLISTTMTGREKWKAIWESMGQFFYDALGQMTTEYIKNSLYKLAVHEETEAAQTASTVAGETTRTGVVQTNLLIQVASKIAAAVKSVAIYLWEASAAIYAWFAATLGPFGLPAAAAMVAGLVTLINAMKKGFYGGGHTGDGDSHEVAGVVHKNEVVFQSDIVKGNLSELMGLRALMMKGFKLKDIMMPGIKLNYAAVPMPTVSGGYYNGGYTGQGGSDSLMREVLAELKATRRMWESGRAKSRLDFRKKELAMIVEEGNNERRSVK